MQSDGVPEAGRSGAEERAVELFGLGQSYSRNKEFQKAADAFAAAEEVVEDVPERALWRLIVRLRQGMALSNAGLREEALVVFEGLIASVEKLKAADYDHSLRQWYPDDVAAMYWARAIVLEELGRMAEAAEAISVFIAEFGTGSTPVQRQYYGTARLTQASYAIDQGNPGQALSDIAAVLSHCARYSDESWVAATLWEARNLRQRVKRRARQDKTRSFVKRFSKSAPD